MIRPFGNLRKIIKLKSLNEEDIVQLMKTHFNPKQVNAILVEDTDTYLKIQETYMKHFARNKIFRVIRCTSINEDITEELEQDEIIKSYHQENNHRGIIETYEHLKRTYYFPNMKNKINLYINQCEICQKEKYERNPVKVKYNETQTPKQPLEIIHIDVFFIKKSEPILTIIDKFSRYAQAFILESRNTPHIKEKLQQYFGLFGKPKLIVADQERSITTIEIKNFLLSNNIKIHFTSVNSSNSNSPVERFHSTLAEHLRIIINNEQSTMINALNKALHAYNNSINSITKYTPFELFFGRKIDEPLEIDIAKIKEKKIEIQSEAFNNSLSKKKQYIEKRNENRDDPKELPKDVYLRIKTNTKLQPRNKKLTINRQKQLNIYDRNDIKHHKNKVNKPRKQTFQGVISPDNMQHRSARHDDESGTDDNSDETDSTLQELF